MLFDKEELLKSRAVSWFGKTPSFKDLSNQWKQNYREEKDEELISRLDGSSQPVKQVIIDPNTVLATAESKESRVPNTSGETLKEWGIFASPKSAVTSDPNKSQTGSSQSVSVPRRENA